MVDYVQTLSDLLEPLVDNKDSIKVQQMEGLNDDEVVLYVYAKEDEIARLIGKKGQMAMAVRDSMAIAGRKDNKRIVVKFEEL